MHSAATLQPLLLLVGSLLLVAAALHDLAARTIPDTFSTVLACIGLVLRWHDGTLLPASLAAALIFGVTFILWHRGWMGGGDVKLLAAASLIVMPAQLPGVVTAIAATGALLALPYLALRNVGRPQVASRRGNLVLRAWRAERFRLRRGGPLPYGVAIALGTLIGLAEHAP